MTRLISLYIPHKVFYLQLLKKGLNRRLSTENQIPDSLLRIVNILHDQCSPLAMLL
jgi:hypothetical protein